MLNHISYLQLTTWRAVDRKQCGDSSMQDVIHDKAIKNPCIQGCWKSYRARGSTMMKGH